MDKFIIEGGRRLKGEVAISGSKNAALPILASTLLCDEACVIKGVPRLRDTNTMLAILHSLGKCIYFKDGQAQVVPSSRGKFTVDYELLKTMRASFCVLGPLLAKIKKAHVSYPGGCVIGDRPVDLHIYGLKALGARIEIDSGYIYAEANRLYGSYIFLGGAFGSSVLATANVMMAATLAKGKTVIEAAACEPEVADLAEFLIKMGAKIKGQGTHMIEIEGVKRLHGAEHKVIPDRIEAGTFMIGAMITKGDVTIKNVVCEHLGAVVDRLSKAGAHIEMGNGVLRVYFHGKLRPVNVTTLPYPGFPTDLQAQFVSLACFAFGVSVISEKVFPERFMHIPELSRMGASIQREGPYAIVDGGGELSGAPVMASDLRASAALVLAGLAAKGRTSVSRIYHLERGYERMDEKLRAMGATIWREKEKIAQE